LGLIYLSHMLPYVLHGGNIIDFFKIDEFSKKIRKDVNEKRVFQELTKKYLIDNNHKLKLTFLPDKEFS